MHHVGKCYSRVNMPHTHAQTVKSTTGSRPYPVLCLLCPCTIIEGKL